MKLLPPKELKKQKEVKSISAAEIATSTNKKLQEFNLFKINIANQKVKLLNELEVFTESIASEKSGLLSEIKTLEKRKEEAQKPIEMTLEEAKNIEKQADSKLKKAEEEREKAEKLSKQANEYFHQVHLFMLESLGVITALIDTMTVERSIPDRIQEMKPLFALLNDLKNLRAENEVLMTEFKTKYAERMNILNLLIDENIKEKDKIANEYKHIESQQQAIKAGLELLDKKRSA